LLITESKESYLKLIKETEINDFILIPIFYNDKVHPILNNISIIYISKNEEFVVPINHPDCLNISNEEVNKLLSLIKLSKNKKFIIDKRNIQHNFKEELDETWKDMELLDYIISNKLKNNFYEYTQAHKFIYRKFYNNSENNLIIPLQKHIEYLHNIKDKILKLLENKNILESDTYNKMNSLLLNNLYRIERNGIKTDNADELIFYKYNPYTSTERPSCTYNGFNFVAMNKNDGTRKHFISRFSDSGYLLLIDYNAYHFYLIADIIGEKFKEHPYKVLGKIFFNKDDLTEEEYKQSKQLLFEIIYGNIPEEFLSIPFFYKTQKFITELYRFYKENSYTETRLFKKKISNIKNITPNKLFNYYLQAYETENNMIMLDKLYEFMENYESKTVLYIYDSVLIDFNLNDGKDFILKIKDIIEQDHKFPVSILYGKDYENLIKIV